MKRIPIQRWGSQFPFPRARPRLACASQPLQHHHHHYRHLQQPHNHRRQSTLATNSPPPQPFDNLSTSDESPQTAPPPLESLPSPPPSTALTSAKLSALHARLSLPPRLPLQTLARALVHPSADPDPAFNNAALARLGANLLGYYTTEHLLCHYPRLPVSVLYAAISAYIGPTALATIAREWGVEAAAEPGGELDPGLLQFRRLPAGSPYRPAPSPNSRPNARFNWRRGTASRIIYDDQLGAPKPATGGPAAAAAAAVPLEAAAESFVKALLGALYLHTGRLRAHRFCAAHVLSRSLDLASLFDFRTPTRDLSRLCAREGFEPPVARLVSETGRLSRHPVFVVAVYSGKDKLGEGAGASLDEARVRAAAAALKAWYLYRPLDVVVPSAVEGGVGGVEWRPNIVDVGEVVV